jgi:2-dehydropantoate 2-reductase
MRVLVYGGGSVGLGLASCLIKSDAEVDIVARKQTVVALRKGGLVRRGIFGQYYAPPDKFEAFTSLKEVIKRTYDYIIVCVKSFDSAQAARDLAENKALFCKETKIVLFQNGWGNAEIFTSFFKREQIYNARVITGFHRPSNNEVEITVHAEAIHIGSLYGSSLSCMEKLCEFIDKGGIPCEKTSNIAMDLWAKMLYNCALNPLGAILDVPYGALAANEFARVIMNNIVEEIFEVMKKGGYETHWQRAKDYLEVFYKRLVPDTAGHKSSTLQDILAKKKTEIEALNGAVIRLAEQYRVRVPHNTIVYNMVKFIETGG